MPAIVTTRRLRLRTWSPGDLTAARGVWGDPEVMAKMVGDVARTDAEVLARLEAEIDRQRRYGYQAWAVELLEAGPVIGACGFYPFDGGPVIELSFKLARPHWGRGYATEACRAAIRHALDVIAPPKIVAGTLGEHRASARVLEKLGFEYHGMIVWPDSKEADPYYELADRGLYRRTCDPL